MRISFSGQRALTRFVPINFIQLQTIILLTQFLTVAPGPSNLTYSWNSLRNVTFLVEYLWKEGTSMSFHHHGLRRKKTPIHAEILDFQTCLYSTM